VTSSPSRRDALALATVAALAGGAALLAGCGLDVRARATVNAGTPTAVPESPPPTATAAPSPTPPPAPVATATPTAASVPTVTSTLPAVSATTGSPPAPTPQETAVALAQGAAVWQSVVRATKGTIVPLLRPTVLPAGIATVGLLRAESGMFDVDYTGPGKRLRISVGQLNPPPGAGETPVVVRGQHVALVLHPADVPEGSDWLTWREPGHWQPFGAAPPEPFVEYFVFVQGVGPAEVQQVLTSLTPLPLPGRSATPTSAGPVAGTGLDTTVLRTTDRRAGGTDKR
jgi:hypothetical protein